LDPNTAGRLSTFSTLLVFSHPTGKIHWLVKSGRNPPTLTFCTAHLHVPRGGDESLAHTPIDLILGLGHLFSLVKSKERQRKKKRTLHALRRRIVQSRRTTAKARSLVFWSAARHTLNPWPWLEELFFQGVTQYRPAPLF